MVEFYCSECNNKILQKVYRGYDRTFCSEFCRKNVTEWYVYNNKFEIERKKKYNLEEEKLCNKLKSVSFRDEIYKKENIINVYSLREVEELSLRHIFYFIYDKTKTYLIN